MVPKGLKVGDSFQDGGRAYKVLSVNSDGTYFSKVVEKNETTEILEDSKEVVVEGKKYTKTEINRMAKEDLVVLAQEHGVEIGTTAEMRRQLIEKLNV